MDPVSTLTAAAIAELAFKKFIESSAGELAKKFTEGAIAKMDTLRQKTVEKLQGNATAENAIATIQQGSKAGLEQLTPYLHIAMDEDPAFAQNIQRLAQDILVLTRTEGRNIQNIYGGQGFQVNDPTAPVIQGGSGNTININYGTPPNPPAQTSGNSTPTPSQSRPPMTSTAPSDSAVEVFFSYSHEDEALRDQLANHLSSLQRQGVIQKWHDRQIPAGKEWAGQIDAHLEAAQIILLLISADFIASDYCYDVEMTRALERHQAGEARVIPIILRPTEFQGMEFSRLQALPRDAKPVTSWENRDEAFLNIAQGIRLVAEELRGQPH
jgi:hypothetical protein